MSWPIRTSTSITVVAGSTIVTPGEHVSLVDPPLGHGPDRRQPDPVVDAQLAGVVDLVREHAPLARAHDRQHVGQVQLALRVVAPHLVERREQRRALERIDAGADLPDPQLELGRVAGRLRLDHALDRAVRRPHHSPVATRIVEHRRGERRRRARARVRLGQPGQRLGLNQRVVGVQHDDGVGPVDLLRRRLDRIRRPTRLLLDRHRHVAVQQRLQRPVGTFDHDHLAGAGRPGSRHRPGDNRPATDLVEQLRRRGAHPRTLPRGEDHDDRRGHAKDRRGSRPKGRFRRDLALAGPPAPVRRAPACPTQARAGPRGDARRTAHGARCAGRGDHGTAGPRGRGARRAAREFRLRLFSIRLPSLSTPRSLVGTRTNGSTS